jgi:Zn-dependent M28 family amino/carboxypeptidase
MVLVTKMPGASYSGPLPELSEIEKAIQNKLKKYVEILAGEIGERNIWQYPSLLDAAEFIQKSFRNLGFKVRFQGFYVDSKFVKNMEVEIQGKTRPDEIVIIGAHYDTVYGSPGANDNASGIAALFEISRLLREHPLQRTIRLVAFVNEEPPFFQTSRMGSLVYASHLRRQKENLIAMISLETIGYYTEGKGSQNYPYPLNYYYPDVGNFLGFVGNLHSKDLLLQTIKAFRNNTCFPSQGCVAPGWLPGIGWSDHWAFWKKKYPAIMITDTAPFRYKYYHCSEDTPEKLEYDCLARIVKGLARVFIDLSGKVN